MAKNPAKPAAAKADESTESTSPVVDGADKAPEAPKAGVWTAEGTLAEQIEKQKLINSGELKRA